MLSVENVRIDGFLKECAVSGHGSLPESRVAKSNGLSVRLTYLTDPAKISPISYFH